MLVEVYDETHQAHTACVVRLEKHEKHTLTFKESMLLPEEGEVYLECAGNVPRRCEVRVE
jgi:hypothetical protein